MANERRRAEYGRRATDTKQALLDAAQSAVDSEVEHRKTRGREQKRRARRRLLPAIFAVTVAFSLYALLTRPAWLQTPPPPSDTPAVQEANLRIIMYTQAMRVERFVEENGRVPETLAEASAAAVGTRIESLDDNAWALHGSTGAVELTLKSTDVMRDFLGNSFEVLAARGES
ncbi:MAG: hypothetical protein HKM89_07210 [Gemmatimonadales bacterium]|nr:hypothetical protein [Gemmatimonadales bacterium]